MNQSLGDGLSGWTVDSKSSRILGTNITPTLKGMLPGPEAGYPGIWDQSRGDQMLPKAELLFTLGSKDSVLTCQINNQVTT